MLNIVAACEHAVRPRIRGELRPRGDLVFAAVAGEEAGGTLDVIVRDVDPRQAICEAYGVLLDELAAIGLPRRPEEAPNEHITRCLRRGDLDEANVTRLVDLFALARFSGHPVTEEHRVAAVRCLRDSRR